MTLSARLSGATGGVLICPRGQAQCNALPTEGKVLAQHREGGGGTWSLHLGRQLLEVVSSPSVGGFQQKPDAHLLGALSRGFCLDEGARSIRDYSPVLSGVLGFLGNASGLGC